MTNVINVGIAGTFDVENLGDLLFPIVAQSALEARDARIKVHPYSPNARAKNAWPYEVSSLVNLRHAVEKLDGMLIGGGNIIRFDGGYPIEVPAELRLPTAYWLSPALAAASAGKPIIWNAIGAYVGSPAAPWLSSAVEAAISASSLIAVRDQVSKEYLDELAPGNDVRIVPDTAFYLSVTHPFSERTAEFLAWKKQHGIDREYIVLQANSRIADYRAEVEAALSAHPDAAIVVLPICWCHGDRAEDFPDLSRPLTRSNAWLPPLLIVEILAGARLIVGSSLHLCIIGITYGVPVIRAPVSPVPDRKFELLSEFTGICLIDDAVALERIINHGLGTESQARKASELLSTYWDNVVEILLERTSETPPPLAGLIIDLLTASEDLAKVKAALVEMTEHRDAIIRENVMATSSLSGNVTAALQVSQLPVSHPDHAPTGLSWGDTAAFGELAGWHWLTAARPDNANFGFQVGISDTNGQVRYRTKRYGEWTAWRGFAPIP
jgi:lipopolysaccharide transport system ATP-binding protein